MDYLLTEEQIMIRDLARQVAEEKIVPVRAHLDETGTFPWDIMKVLAQSDLFGLFIPEEYGGLGKGCLELCLCVEELSRACVGVSTSYAANALGTYPPCFSEQQSRKRNSSRISLQARLVAFGLTEANAGSDANSYRQQQSLTATNILNGTKQWITNGGEAKLYHHRHGQIKGPSRRISLCC
jgi:butyryl-CoA dehydrogenase